MAFFSMDMGRSSLSFLLLKDYEVNECAKLFIFQFTKTFFAVKLHFKF